MLDNLRKLLFGVLIAIGAFCIPSAKAQPFSDGASGLYIGHSFFVPVARRFDEFAQRLGYPGHQFFSVFSPGETGAPGALWRNEEKREAVRRILSSGEIELLGMTAHHTNSDLEDYRRWVDLALSYNRSTAFLIGGVWPSEGPLKSMTKFREEDAAIQARLFRIVADLRNEYPDTQFYFLDYGQIAIEMKEDFEKGDLQDLDRLVGDTPKALFRDASPGHPGKMMTDIMAGLWVLALYGSEVRRIPGYDRDDVARLLAEGLEGNNLKR